MRQKKWFPGIVVVLPLLLLLGCGDTNLFESIADDSAKQARLEEARTAMDNGDYADAVSILEDEVDPNGDDGDEIRLLAAGYLGMAGVTLAEMLRATADIASQPDDPVKVFIDTLYAGEDYDSPDFFKEKFIFSDKATHLLDNYISRLDSSQQITEGNHVFLADIRLQAAVAHMLHLMLNLTYSTNFDLSSLQPGEFDYNNPKEVDYTDLAGEAVDVVLTAQSVFNDINSAASYSIKADEIYHYNDPAYRPSEFTKAIKDTQTKLDDYLGGTGDYVTALTDFINDVF